MAKYYRVVTIKRLQFILQNSELSRIVRALKSWEFGDIDIRAIDEHKLLLEVDEYVKGRSAIEVLEKEGLIIKQRRGKRR